MGRYCTVDIRAWEVAGELEVGDHIWSISGEWGRVEAVSVSHDPQLMYNLAVDDAHTFFVGEQAWLVHNTCLDTYPGIIDRFIQLWEDNRVTSGELEKFVSNLLENEIGSQNLCGNCAAQQFNEFVFLLDDESFARLIRDFDTSNLQLPEGLNLNRTRFNVERPDAFAYEFMATGKPNPNYAVYAGGVEFDWYRVDSQGNVIYMDAKLAIDGGWFDLSVGGNFITVKRDKILAQMNRQLAAAGTSYVEWIVPSANIAAGLSEFFDNKLPGENIIITVRAQ
jgi:Pretoxin HINT domain